MFLYAEYWKFQHWQFVNFSNVFYWPNFAVKFSFLQLYLWCWIGCLLFCSWISQWKRSHLWIWYSWIVICLLFYEFCICLNKGYLHKFVRLPFQSGLQVPSLLSIYKSNELVGIGWLNKKLLEVLLVRLTHLSDIHFLLYFLFKSRYYLYAFFFTCAQFYAKFFSLSLHRLFSKWITYGWS